MGLFDRTKKIDAIVEQAVAKTLSLSTEQVYNLMQTGSFSSKKKVTDAFQQIPYVYACVHVKALNIAQVPLIIYKGDKRIETGPAIELFKRINPEMGIADLVYWMVAAINLRGNGYAYWNDIKAKLPEYLVPAVDVKPKRSNGWISSYEIKRGNETIRRDAEMVLHVKNYSHNDVGMGMAPLAALRDKVELSHNADMYNAAFFENDATPATAFSTERTIAPKELEELRHKLIDRRKGSRESMILQGGLKLQQLGISQKDADFVNLYKLTREEIGAVFGVPESEVNIFTETKYSNAQTASTSFWEKTLIPEAKLIAGAISRQVLHAVDLECEFDFDRVDAVAKKGFGERVDQAQKLIAMGFGVNEVNDLLELGFDPEVERVRPEPQQPEPVKAVDTAKSYEAFEHAQSQKWHRLIKSVDTLEARMGRVLKNYFHKVQNRILQSIGEGKGSSYAVNKDYDEGAVRAAFDDEELTKACEELLRDAIGAGAAEIAGRNIAASTAQAVLEDKLIKIVETNKTSRDVVITKIREALNESLEAGDGYTSTAKKIKDALKDAMDINRNRAETIARTEIGGAFNQAGYKAADENGAIGTRWISARDGNVRDSHTAYDGQIKKTGDLFGGVIGYPHDPDGPAGEVINCRCMFEPMYEGEL